MHQPVQRFWLSAASPDCHLQHIQRQVGTQMIVSRQPTITRENTSMTNAA
jgi:hypothetical protein